MPPVVVRLASRTAPACPCVTSLSPADLNRRGASVHDHAPTPPATHRSGSRHTARDRGPVALRWHRTTLDGRVARYAEAGTSDADAPLVVFVHGWGLTSRAYAAMLPGLARAGARVIAPALPGFGHSEPLDGAYTFPRLANWMADLLDHVGTGEPAFFIGHSFGGGVATATAHHHPHLVRSLTLVNSVGGAVWQGADGDAADAAETSSDPTMLADRPLWHWGVHFPSELRTRRLAPALPVIARDFVQNALRNPRALARAAGLARRADLREELADLAARGLPISVLWGDQDKVIPKSAFLALCEAAGAEGHVIEDGSHSWLLADPDGFAECVTNSLVIHALLTRGQTYGSPVASVLAEDRGAERADDVVVVPDLDAAEVG